MKLLFFLTKVVFSLALIIFFISKIDYESIKNVVDTTTALKALTVGILIVLLQAFLGGSRLPFVLKLYNHTIDMMTGIRIWFIGSFFSQTMISFVGGDALRILSLTRLLIPKKMAASAILLDRVVGFVVLTLFFLIFLPFVIAMDNMSVNMRYGLIMLSLMSGMAITSFLLLGLVPDRFLSGTKSWLVQIIELAFSSRYLFLSFKKTLMILLLSGGIQLLNTYAIYEMFHIYHANVSFFDCLMLLPPIVLISMLPISFAGWGARETAMIAGFSLLGIPKEIILAVSITFGVSVFLGSLPGMLLFVKRGAVERQQMA